MCALQATTGPALNIHRKLTDAELQQMLVGARILEKDSFGPKVYALNNGEILKVFRRKRMFSSTLLRPSSQRFYDNAVGLSALGIPTVTPLACYRLDDARRTAVRYQPLPGETLSDRLRHSPEQWRDILPPLASFINQLHAQGVYFRSLHAGNIVITANGEFGLIDVADMRLRRRPLSKALIRRNREHFEKHARKERLPLEPGTLWAACERAQATRLPASS